MPFDPTFKLRPLSPSCINSFLYDKEKWYETYILNKRQTSEELTFGSMIDKRLETDPTFLPEVPRCPMLQHSMTATFSGIHLTGKPDALDLENFILRDYKTGKNKWDKKRADESLQLTFYLFLVYLNYKIPPEKFGCYIDWMETTKISTAKRGLSKGEYKIEFVKNMKVKHIKTKRTMSDLIKLGNLIKTTVKEMQEYVDNRVA